MTWARRGWTILTTLAGVLILGSSYAGAQETAGTCYAHTTSTAVTCIGTTTLPPADSGTMYLRLPNSDVKASFDSPLVFSAGATAARWTVTGVYTPISGRSRTDATQLEVYSPSWTVSHQLTLQHADPPAPPEPSPSPSPSASPAPESPSPQPSPEPEPSPTSSPEPSPEAATPTVVMRLDDRQYNAVLLFLSTTLITVLATFVTRYSRPWRVGDR